MKRITKTISICFLSSFVIDTTAETSIRQMSKLWLWRIGTLALPITLAFSFSSKALHGQAIPTASRTFDLQAGGSFVVGRSKYLSWDTQGNAAPLSDTTRMLNILGGGAYATLDVTPHIGAEIDVRHVQALGDTSKQTTYEIGGRYILTHRFAVLPYARAAYGRGTYHYSQDAANLSFNLFGVAGGVDWHVLPAFTVRAEYEYQSWMGVPMRNPSPNLVTLGIAYHFH